MNDDTELAEVRAELMMARDEIRELRSMNHGMEVENAILRGHLTAAEGHRIRLQAICASLGGRLRAIQAVIDDAVKEAVKNGNDAIQNAAEKPKPEEPVRQIPLTTPANGRKVEGPPPHNVP